MPTILYFVLLLLLLKPPPVLETPHWSNFGYIILWLRDSWLLATWRLGIWLLRTFSILLIGTFSIYICIDVYIYVYILFLNHLLLTNFTKKAQFEISKGMLVLDERHVRKVYWPYNTVYNTVYNPASIKYIPFPFLLALALLPVRQGGQGVDIQITLEMSNKLCNFFNESLKSGICQKKIFWTKKVTIYFIAK